MSWSEKAVRFGLIDSPGAQTCNYPIFVSIPRRFADPGRRSGREAIVKIVLSIQESFLLHQTLGSVQGG